MDYEDNSYVQLKIQQMMNVKRAKDRKILYNNPPKKESYLKGSKDLIGDTLEYKFAKDVFGA
jgi:hypothetical protein